jgi:hypothetical protein
LRFMLARWLRWLPDASGTIGTMYLSQVNRIVGFAGDPLSIRHADAVNMIARRAREASNGFE